MEISSQSIRKAFLDFFEKKGHHIVDSAPMVIKDDPTLMFTNAGMNQFKDIFLGNAERKFPRVADTQKCLRVSGKHNDLEEVGHDTYHHTMFEMLGNWSFGDYFKKESIAWAWEFLTEVMKIDKDRLYVTVFGGDEKDHTEKDMEAFAYWEEHIAKDRILFGNKKDNFWEMGDTGPCGPCSEIHVDIRDEEERRKIDARELVNKDNPQVIEIWNLVFMQHVRMADGHLEDLPSKCIDTGMGFERLCMVVQGKKSNYDTDVFQPMIKALANTSGIPYGKDRQTDVAMRVIADHVRAVSFAIADGQLPSNNKAGYVIRRILRRAVRYGCSFLGFDEPFMHKLVDVLVDQMGEQFTELKKQHTLISKVIAEEEVSFLKTLDTGSKLFNQLADKLKAENKDTLSGVDAFTLYDTYGFPLDLTELMLKEKGLKLDEAGFEQEMQKQKSRSRMDAAVIQDDWVVLNDSNEINFVGYDQLEADVHILKYRKVNKKGKDLYQILFSPTPFYAESGGQVGDRGYLEDKNSGERIAIIDTVKENNTIVHWATQIPQDPQSEFTAVVDKEKRMQTACNHSCTHLMHYALRQILGSHVEQKGSMVNEKELRFDFSHFQKMSAEEIREVERMVNRLIRSDLFLDEHRNMPIEEARAMGAMALFSEKYGDHVRVIRYGDSVELCGGTHIASTGQIGYFKIVSEGAVAAGVRRITAMTGAAAEDFMYATADLLGEIRDVLKSGQDVLGHVQKIMETNARLKKEVEANAQEKIQNLHLQLLSQQEMHGDIPVIKSVSVDYPADIAKSLCMSFRKDFGKGIVLLAGTVSQKPTIYLFVGDELVKQGKNAGTVIKSVAPMIKGSGGGQPFFATCTGSEASMIQEAVAEILRQLGMD